MTDQVRDALARALVDAGMINDVAWRRLEAADGLIDRLSSMGLEIVPRLEASRRALEMELARDPDDFAVKTNLAAVNKMIAQRASQPGKD